MAGHARALRRIVAACGRVDPGALVLSVQGLRALARLPRIVRLVLRGKINPLRTLFGTKTTAAEPARRLLGREAPR
jgi:succinate dehydrogenase / fumarate reductase iron-sulfur subunit